MYLSIYVAKILFCLWHNSRKLCYNVLLYQTFPVYKAVAITSNFHITSKLAVLNEISKLLKISLVK